MRFSSASELISFLHSIPEQHPDIDFQDECLMNIGKMMSSVSSFEELYQILVLMSEKFVNYDFRDGDAISIN